MARRRSLPEPAAPEVGDVNIPMELLAASCVELWTTADERARGLAEHETATGIPPGIAVGLRARRRFREARAAFLDEHGLPDDADVPAPLRRRADAPWSFDYLAVNDPERLADDLARRGLPPGWRPRPRVGPVGHTGLAARTSRRSSDG